MHPQAQSRRARNTELTARRTRTARPPVHGREPSGSRLAILV